MIMLQRILILGFVFIGSINILGQTEKSTAPINWQRYKISSDAVSLSLPKLPNLRRSGNTCFEIETREYAAYAAGIVYGFNINSEAKTPAPFICTDRKKFDEQNFTNRIQEVKSFLKTNEQTTVNLNNSAAVKINNKFFTYWLINDFKNKRWFEFWVSESNDTDQNIKNFINSLKYEKATNAIEIGEGSDRTLGDELVVGKTENKLPETESGKTEKVDSIGVRIVVKPSAIYTDAARQNQIQGIVSLRVTFSADGGIGSAVPATNFPSDLKENFDFGLREQAIAAAKKMVFIPAKKDGVPVTIIKTVQYSFVLY